MNLGLLEMILIGGVILAIMTGPAMILGRGAKKPPGGRDGLD